MSKKTDKKPEAQEVQAPDFLQELRDKGTVIISATKREELATIVNDIPAEVMYGAGAIGYNPKTRAYTLRLDLIK